MLRLTTDMPIGIMENCLNLFYAKDGEAWVRDGAPGPLHKDVRLFDYTRNAIQATLDEDQTYIASFTDEELSETMVDWLSEGNSSGEGLIGTLYTAAWAFAEIRERLKLYEDSGLTPEEVSMYAKARAEGRISELPCQIGSEVWELRCSLDNSKGKHYDFSLSTVQNRERYLRDSRVNVYAASKRCTKSDLNHLGKTVFLTKEEADAVVERR